MSKNRWALLHDVRNVTIMRFYYIFNCEILGFLIYPSMFSVLILLFHRVWSDALDHHGVVFWIHITPLWNWWCSTQCFFSIHNTWGIVTSFVLHRAKTVQSTISASKLNLHVYEILILNIKATLWCIYNDFQQLIQDFSMMLEGYIINLKFLQ